MEKGKRFVKIYTQGVVSTQEIWQDTETGVQYFWVSSGYAGGLTPLLDAAGCPVVGPLEP